ncbi:MAG: TIGR01777 family oxidoreductase [Acidobacteriota bacterium]
MSQRFDSRLDLPVARSEAWAWHFRPGAFDRLAPPWQDLELVERYERLADGARLVFKLRKGPLALRWVARHEAVEPETRFVDVMERGPFASWRHEHRFEELAAGSDGEPRSRLVDDVRYRLPLAPLSSAVAGGFVHDDLERMFTYRRRTLLEDLALHARLRARRGAETKPLRVAVTGASGLIGRALCAVLSTGGHEVVRIVRGRPRGAVAPGVAATHEVGWTDGAFVGDLERLEGLDAFIDLAGENVAAGPWNARRKAAIRSSREGRVAQVVRALGALDAPPRVYACASAIGIYGDTGDRVVDAASSADASTDESIAASSFLADVARAWEQAALGAEAWAERVVRLRFGVVLSPAGGALAKMLPTQRLGLGAVPGSGRQLVSWIALDDAVAAVLHAVVSELEGPVDVVAPRPVPMAQLVREIGSVLRRPVPARIPSSLLRLGLGQMATETVLASTGVRPAGLLDDGFVFRHDDLDDALRHLLGRARSESPEVTAAVTAGGAA